mgnify:CR=1 FL=1
MTSGIVNVLTQILKVGKKLVPLFFAYKAGKDAQLKERYEKAARTKQRQLRIANKPDKSVDDLIGRMQSGDL